jgi:hypothetical protein
MVNDPKVSRNYSSHKDNNPSYLRQQCVSGDDGHLESTCPLVYGRHVLPPLEGSDLGALEKLPTELKHEILRLQNLKSLLAFRQVNRYANATVKSLTESKKVKL